MVGILFKAGDEENELLKPLINCSNLINVMGTDCEFEMEFKKEFKAAFSKLSNPDLLQYTGSLTVYKNIYIYFFLI